MFNKDSKEASFKRLSGNLILKKKMYGINRPSNSSKRIKLVVMQECKEELEEQLRKYSQCGYQKAIASLTQRIQHYQQEFFVDSEKEEDDEIPEDDDEDNELSQDEQEEQQADRNFIQDDTNSNERK